MIELGRHNYLKVLRKEEKGYFLEGDDIFGDILLPYKFAPSHLKINDEIEVFVYLDSEDLSIATTLKPYAVVGEFAALKVSSVEDFGVFLDWGLDKELLVPFREQLYEMRKGQSYIVYLYIDKTNRIAATTRLKPYIQREKPIFKEGDEVEALLYQQTDLGIKAIVSGSHDGLIYKDDIMNHLKIGQKITAYVKTIRSDYKIDLSLRPIEKSSEDSLPQDILKKLEDAGGTLNITAKTQADIINSMFHTSRKKFKIALGSLYKKRLITVDEDKISLVKK